MTDLYHTLEVSVDADARQLKSAYRRLARQWHPDVSASPEAHARFAEINEAYQILSDPLRRAAYDRGEDVTLPRTFYAAAAYAAAVVAKEREFNLELDAELAVFRQEMAERQQAVLVVVPLFISAFLVMATKPEGFVGGGVMGKLAILVLAIVGLFYLVKNLKDVLRRYTYQSEDSFTTVFREEAPKDKSISRKAGLIFLACGYLSSLGLGYVASLTLPLVLGTQVSFSTLVGCLVYPPIGVLLVNSLRKVVSLLFDRI